MAPGPLFLSPPCSPKSPGNAAGGSSASQPVSPGAASEKADEESARETLKANFHASVQEAWGSVLKAWRVNFDCSVNKRVSFAEFDEAVLKLDVQWEDVKGLFRAYALDDPGDVSFEEIDHDQWRAWYEFEKWCASEFDTLAECMVYLSGNWTEDQQTPAADITIWPSGFRSSLGTAGWSAASAQFLFHALNVQEKDFLSESDFSAWFDQAKTLFKKKERSRQKALREKMPKRTADQKAIVSTIADFKRFLVKRYGDYVRAWRLALAPHGGMVVQKCDLFKACSRIGWQGDVRLLYKALDKDDSGFVSLEELDPKGAQMLAHFHAFAMKHFGNASATFKALDRRDAKKLRKNEFVAALQSYGFDKPVRPLFHRMATRGKKVLIEEDLEFLDKWKPPAFLIAAPNPQAAEEVRELLLIRFKTLLKAWKNALDPDSGNHCTFDEFEAACKRIGYSADIPGAWRAFDSDLGGFISYMDIDPVGSATICEFKKWCNEEFGSLNGALHVLLDGFEDCSSKEVMAALRSFGFPADARLVVQTLDMNQNHRISEKELEFLAQFDLNEFDKDLDVDRNERSSLSKEPPVRTFQPANMFDYSTDGPGPAAYSSPAGLGSGPGSLGVRFSGAYSFRRRLPCSATGWSHMAAGMEFGSKVKPPQSSSHPPPSSLVAHSPYKDAAAVSPQPSPEVGVWKNILPHKPAWQFGSERRDCVDASPAEGGPCSSPGPGYYAVERRERQNPATFAATCLPRRPLKLHPLIKAT